MSAEPSNTNLSNSDTSNIVAQLLGSVASTSRFSIPSSSSFSGHNATAGTSSQSQPGVSRVCRDCAFEIFLHELYPWWARERARVLAGMAAHPLHPPPGAIPSESGSQSQSSSATTQTAASVSAAIANGTVAPANLLLDEGEGDGDDDGAGDDDSDDEGYPIGGASSHATIARSRGDIVVMEGSAQPTPLPARLPE